MPNVQIPPKLADSQDIWAAVTAAKQEISRPTNTMPLLRAVTLWQSASWLVLRGRDPMDALVDPHPHRQARTNNLLASKAWKQDGSNWKLLDPHSRYQKLARQYLLQRFQASDPWAKLLMFAQSHPAHPACVELVQAFRQRLAVRATLREEILDAASKESAKVFDIVTKLLCLTFEARMYVAEKQYQCSIRSRAQNQSRISKKCVAAAFISDFHLAIA